MANHPTTGETDLNALIRSMEPVLQDGVFVFVTVDWSLDSSSLSPVMSFREQEGMTLIVTRENAESYRLKYEFSCRMITLNVHSSLDAVGFLARITQRLAAKNMGVNAVSAFFHDHLFVPEDRADDALKELRKIIVEG